MRELGEDWLLRSRRVVVDGELRPATLRITGGEIAEVLAWDEDHGDLPREDVEERVVSPGLVDSHVHVNEPGRTEWEGFDTATGAAATGGITTIADMPLNCSPVTTTCEAFATKLAEVDDKLHVDCAFYGGVVPGNAEELAPLAEMGVVGFKCFLIHSGLDEFPHVREADLREAMPALAAWRLPLLVHAELDREDEEAGFETAAPREYREFLRSRPPAWEREAIELMVGLCRELSCRTHIVHLSASEALGAIAEARGEGLPFTVETCPHYLTLAAEEVPEGDTRFKCAPPIREAANRGRLWEALEAGLIDFVVSDHSPCEPALKRMGEGDFMAAWGGISSLQLGLPVVWSEARRRGATPVDLARWMSSGPARFLGLGDRKGRIAPGLDADLVVWDPEEQVVVRGQDLRHRHPLTPYEGARLRGAVHRTYLRGREVVRDGELVQPAEGAPVLRRDGEERR